MIVFIADIVHQALTMITCSRTAMVYHCKISIDFISGFRTHLPEEICKMVAWVLAKDRFICPTNVYEVSLKYPSCLIIVMMIN